MILFTFDNSLETRKGFSCEAFRWTFQVGKNHIGFVHQYKLDGKWFDSHCIVYEVRISSHFALGRTHVYYDGPHCELALGWLHLNWYNDDCRICQPELK